MAKYRFRFAPYPSDDEDVLFSDALTALPAANVTSYPASGTKGAFTADGYNGAGLGGTGRLLVSGLTNQANLKDAGYISFSVDTQALTKDDSLDAGNVTQSAGALRVASGTLLSCIGDGGNNERLQLYHHTNGTFVLYKFGTGAQSIISPGVTSVGKGGKVDVVWAIHGKLHIIYVDGVEVARGTMTGDYDTNQFASIYVCGNGAFADTPLGDYNLSDLQIGLRPPDPATLSKEVALWSDSFIEAGFGTAGGVPTYGVRFYDTRMHKVVQRAFAASLGVKVKLRGFGYSGYSWSDSFASPQTDNQAAVAAANPEILVMANSVNGVANTLSLVADYQSSLEAHVDYMAANCSNLKKIAFVSLFPYTKNPTHAGDAASGVPEAADAVMAGLVAYVNANYPAIEAYFFDAFTALGGHDYPAEWTYGYISETNDLHPSPLGHHYFGMYWGSVIKSLLVG